MHIDWHIWSLSDNISTTVCLTEPLCAEGTSHQPCYAPLRTTPQLFQTPGVQRFAHLNLALRHPVRAIWQQSSGSIGEPEHRTSESIDKLQVVTLQLLLIRPAELQSRLPFRRECLNLAARGQQTEQRPPIVLGLLLRQREAVVLPCFHKVLRAT